MKNVIINADDFGLSEGINKGIVKAFQDGLLTSTSLMVNMPGFEDAISLIRGNPDLSVGFHLNIIRGKPVYPSVKLPSFTRRGYFLGDVLSIVRMIYLNRLKLKELEMECRAQIEKLLQRGITITHMDSEKHLHLIKPLFELMVRIAGEYGITKIRVINEIPYLCRNLFDLSCIFKKNFYKSLLLGIASIQDRAIIKKYNVKTTDYSFSIYENGDTVHHVFRKIFCNLRKGTTEIVCHPGYIGEEWQNYPLRLEKYYLNQNREKELNALLNPELRDLVNALNIRLISYRDV